MSTMQTIDPNRGVYGMGGMEIWIDINARMPTFAREWGCKTLRDREKLVLGGQNTMAPYRCQDGFGTMPDMAAYDVIVEANLDQAAAGISTQAAQALQLCFDAKMAMVVTPDDIASVNALVVGEATQKVIMAVGAAVRACKAEV